MAWDGKERREIVTHQTPLAECVERYNNIVDKLEGLILRLDKMNGRYDTHLVEAISYRATVDVHTKKFDEMTAHRRWLIGIQISTISMIAVQIVTFAYLWGSLNKQVEINTKRWDKVIAGEEIHDTHTGVK
jgi:hypothetical protein